tara:strand:+ start:173 stop:619 length:447 start_codon:yes stop_codon:yes gene_type:complete
MLSLLGSLLGFGTSFLPKVMDYFQDKQDKKHELLLMDKQIDQQKVLGDIKLQTMHVEADIRETESIMQHSAKLQGKASPWVTNLAASVRPVVTYLLFIEIFVLTWLLALDMITVEMYRMVFNGEMQAVWAAVVSFWFGARTMARRSQT